MKSTEVYVQADLEMKRKSLELANGPHATQPAGPQLPSGLIEWLESLWGHYVAARTGSWAAAPAARAGLAKFENRSAAVRGINLEAAQNFAGHYSNLSVVEKFSPVPKEQLGWKRCDEERLRVPGQLEGRTKPVLLFEISSEDRQLGAVMNLKTFHVNNIGSGPAFNVTIAPILGEGVRLDFDEILLIESKETKPIRWSVVQNRERSGMSSRPAWLAHLITEGKFPAENTVTVVCRALSGKGYRTSHKLHYNSREKRVWTEFVRLDAV